MNVGIVTTWFPSGGGYVSKAYKQILEKANKVFVFARQGENMSGDPIWDAENIYWAKKHRYGTDLKDFKRWIINNEIDVIFFNEQRYWKPVILAKKLGLCIGSYIDYYKEETVRAYSIYDFLICNTKRHYSVFDWHPNCYYIPWGTDIHVFKPQRLRKETLTFLISAGWQGKYSGDRRGSLLAMEAFTKVKGECKLLVYSQVKYTDCPLSWRKLVEYDKRVEFIEGTHDPFPYNKGDIYVYPSRLDGIGLSLPEALSCGVPVIATNNPPMNEFVFDGVNGRLVDVSLFIARSDGYFWPQSICSLDSLVNAMQSYVWQPDLATTQGQAARVFAEKKLNWQNNASNLNDIFDYAFNSTRRSAMNSENEIYLLSLDRKDCPSTNYVIFMLCKNILKNMGIDINKPQSYMMQSRLYRKIINKF